MPLHLYELRPLAEDKSPSRRECEARQGLPRAKSKGPKENSPGRKPGVDEHKKLRALAPELFHITETKIRG